MPATAPPAPRARRRPRRQLVAPPASPSRPPRRARPAGPTPAPRAARRRAARTTASRPSTAARPAPARPAPGSPATRPAPTRCRFHQPPGSSSASSASGVSHSTWHTETSAPPASTRCGPNEPSSATGHAQLGAVPRHRRVVPAEPGRVPPVRGQLRHGQELVARAQHPLAAAVQRRSRRAPARCRSAAARCCVRGPPTPRPAARPADRRSGRSGAPRGRRQRHHAGFAQRVNPLIGPVREHHHTVGDRPRPPAVLVQPVADVPRRRQHVLGTARHRPDQRDPALLSRSRLGPPHLVPDDVEPLRAATGGGHLGGGDGRRPGSVRGDPRHPQRLAARERWGGGCRSCAGGLGSSVLCLA